MKGGGREFKRKLISLERVKKRPYYRKLMKWIDIMDYLRDLKRGEFPGFVLN